MKRKRVINQKRHPFTCRDVYRQRTGSKRKQKNRPMFPQLEELKSPQHVSLKRSERDVVSGFPLLFFLAAFPLFPQTAPLFVPQEVGSTAKSHFQLGESMFCYCLPSPLKLQGYSSDRRHILMVGRATVTKENATNTPPSFKEQHKHRRVIMSNISLERSSFQL